VSAVPPPAPEFLAHVAARQAALRAQLATLLPSDRAFTLEIGCGHGHFLVRYAAAHPGELCVGIDLVGDRIRRAVKKRDRARLANLHFLQNEAVEFLDCLPPGARPADVFILFPDPWPKRRHHKNRLLQENFLARLSRHAGRGSRLFFRTDHAEYFAAARAALAAHPAWRLAPDLPWPFEEPTVFQQKAPGYQSLAAVRADPARPAERPA
jgi:tRNA (guanine-N7-)-methyltransferase